VATHRTIAAQEEAQKKGPTLGKDEGTATGARANGPGWHILCGCQWKAVPREFGSGSTLHRYFQEWVRQGVFRKLWKHALKEYDDLKGIDWEWQCIDGTMTKAPLGGEKYGP
jgi:transposase